MADTDTRAFTILALYKFQDLNHLEAWKEEIETILRQHLARGTILLSAEGVNGTICYPSPAEEDPIYAFFTNRFDCIRTRLSYHNTNVFFRLRVRIKAEIVTFGVDRVSPQPGAGEYVEPGEDWDRLIEDPDCLVIDTRNDYEVEVGTFRHAVNPATESFTELKEWLDEQLRERQPKSVAMFCTGGIRCEKSTAYCRELVNDRIPVYHLKGGILAYLDTVDPAKSTFQGECYVFDQRIAVTYGLKASERFQACHACRHPLSAMDRAHADHEPGISCRYCASDGERQQRRERYAARQRQMAVAEQKGIPHIHDHKEYEMRQASTKV